MKKKLIFIVLVLFVSVSIFACHGSKANTEFVMPSEFDTTRNYEIDFIAKNDSFKTQKEEIEKAVKRFQEYYPNITIKVKNETDYTKIYQTVLNNIQTKTTPNICITYPDYIAVFNEGDNIVVPLDDLMNDSKYGFGGSEIKYDAINREDIYEKYLDELIIDGKYYAVPFMRSSEALYINKTMYEEELGLTMPDEFTWDDLWYACVVAKEKHPESSFIPFIYKSTDNMFIQLAYQMGFDYTTSNGDILLFNDEAKSLLLDLQDKFKRGLFNTFKYVSYPGESMNEGNTLLAIDSTAGATWIGTYCTSSDHPGDKSEYVTEVKRVPQVDLSNPKMISQGPSICIFNKDDPQEVLASWLFVQFLLNEETQVNYSKTEGYIPVNRKATETEEYQYYINHPNDKPITTEEKVYYDVKIKAANIVRNNVEYSFVTPVFNGSSLVRKASGDLIEKVIFDVKTKLSNLNDSDYIDQVISLIKDQYKLDSIKVGTNVKKDAPLPSGSIVLIVTLSIVWVGLGTYYVLNYLNNKKKKEEEQ